MIKLVRFLFVCIVLAAIAGGVFVGLTIWYFGRDLPDYQQLAHYEPPIMTRVHAGDGRLLAEAVARDEVEYEIGLPGDGAETEVFFSDLGHEYVTINADYTT